jgi:hypothetical protein
MIDLKRLKTDANYWKELGAPAEATHFLPEDKRFEATWYRDDLELGWLGWLVGGDTGWEPCPSAILVGRQLTPRPPMQSAVSVNSKLLTKFDMFRLQAAALEEALRVAVFAKNELYEALLLAQLSVDPNTIDFAVCSEALALARRETPAEPKLTKKG